MSKKPYTIWMEGYAATGERGGASILGTAFGENFPDAVETLKAEMEKDPEKRGYFRVERGRFFYWGCQLFDNEQDARKGFG